MISELISISLLFLFTLTMVLLATSGIDSALAAKELFDFTSAIIMNLIYIGISVMISMLSFMFTHFLEDRWNYLNHRKRAIYFPTAIIFTLMLITKLSLMNYYELTYNRPIFLAIMETVFFMLPPYLVNRVTLSFGKAFKN
jgi:hypothetical protein